MPMPALKAHEEPLTEKDSQVYDYCRSLRDGLAQDATTFDSANNEFTTDAQSGRNVKLPEPLEAAFDTLSHEDRMAVNRAFFDSMVEYEKRHGCQVPYDVLVQAAHNVYSLSDHARAKYPSLVALDSLEGSTNLHHNPQGLQPSRMITTILNVIGEACPFAHYLPADINSNAARLAVVQNKAQTNHGMYSFDQSMDGINSGRLFANASRSHLASTADGKTFTGKITSIQTDFDHCDPTGTALKLIRGASIIYVNGHPVGKETSTQGSGNSQLTGKLTIAGTDFFISGHINPDTGEFSVVFDKALPASAQGRVLVEAFIDYEREKTAQPHIGVKSEIKEIFATPWRVNTLHTLDAMRQMENEMGLNSLSLALYAINVQASAERHRYIMNRVKHLAANNEESLDFDWSSQGLAKSRRQVWVDSVIAKLALMSQRMVNKNYSHGITHLYVGENMAAEMQGLPSDLFEHSGLSARPGIYRIGRLAGQYEVYFSPYEVNETASSSEVRVIGRAPEVNRNPIVLGDVTAPLVKPINGLGSLDEGAAFYQRAFTCVNPFEWAANSCGTLNITGRI